MTDALIPLIESMAVLGLTWGPVLVIFFMAVESSFIPFPSEVVMIPAGFMAARGEFFPGTSPWGALVVAIICGTLGSILGAYINYWLAVKLGRPFLYRWGRYFFVPPDKLTRAEDIFRQYGDVATFVCRLIPVIRQFISIPAGLARMDFGRFTFFTTAGAGIWVIILSVLGFWFGSNTKTMSYADLVHQGKFFLHDNVAWIILGAVALAALYWKVQQMVLKSGKTPN